MSEKLSPRQKSELLSGLNSTALWLHRTLAEIPADPAFLERGFQRLNFGTLGVQTLSVAGISASSRSQPMELSPEWAALRERIDEPYARTAWDASSGSAARTGLPPNRSRTVPSSTHRKNLITPKPEVAAQSAIRLWNRLVEQIPGWPQARLTPIRRREFYSLKLDQLHPRSCCGHRAVSLNHGRRRPHPSALSPAYSQTPEHRQAEV